MAEKKDTQKIKKKSDIKTTEKTDNKTSGVGIRSNKSRYRKRFGGREKEQSEFDQKIIDIRRVTRVVAGGRRFSLSVAVVVGDKKGRVGVGLGKANDTQLAISKAARAAKKNMIKVMLTKNNSIPHEVRSSYCATKVFIRPTRGTNLVAGSSLRDVLELAGVRGASAKILSRSKNKLNIARATLRALRDISTKT